MSPENINILIVDDDEDVLLSAKIALKRKFSRIYSENDPHRIKDLLNKESIHLVLLDMNFTKGFTSGKEGLRWLRIIKHTSSDIKVVLMTAYGDISLAVQAMKEGATDFILKPWENATLIQTLEAALIEKEDVSQTPLSSQEHKASFKFSKPKHGTNFDSIIGQSPPMLRIFQLIQKVAPTEANILILGENGTGKELIAKAIHNHSHRANKSFIQVDVATIPETLIESELFGHVKGAFTDAKDNRIGHFEAASGGTLFLDEIGNIPLSAQVKLLTVLQQRQVRPVGGNKIVSTDIRLICATNMPLKEMIQAQTFRQDLLYRINTVELILPPLRERMEDIPFLIQYFIDIYATKYQREPLIVSAPLLQSLKKYHWPGNVRELQHQVERATIMGEVDMLLPTSHPASPSAAQFHQPISMEEVEKATIIQALQNHDGNISKAAKALGLGRTTLYRKMNKYGI